MVLCTACEGYLNQLRNIPNGFLGHSDQENDQESDQEIMRRILEFCKKPRSAGEILKEFKLERSYFRRHFLTPMINEGLLQRTNLDNIKDRNQKYFSK